MFNAILDFYLKSHPVTIIVLIVLAVYFIVLNWVFFYRYFSLNDWLEIENKSFKGLLLGSPSVSNESYLYKFLQMSSDVKKEILDLGMLSATKKATKGLALISVFSSTTPFIGLFGTVVSILDTFTHIGQSSGSMSVISSGVSDALVATAAGIFVAIFAFSYHQMLKRKSFDLINFLQMQSDTILSRKE